MLDILEDKPIKEKKEKKPKTDRIHKKLNPPPLNQIMVKEIEIIEGKNQMEFNFSR